MLLVTFKNGETLTAHTLLGQQFWLDQPDSPALKLTPQDVEVIQADGEELLCLINRIASLPYPKNRQSIIWRGDLARFIAEYINNPNAI